MPSADIVDLRAQHGSDIAQPQRETAPGVDPQEWSEVVGSWGLEPAVHIGQLVLTKWESPRPGDVVPNQRDLSRHQQAMLKVWFSNYKDPTKTRYPDPDSRL